MSGFHANGLFDLLRDPAFKRAMQEREEALVREREEEFRKADYWGREELLGEIRRQLRREFAKEHCLF